jgi:hypothetical protein
LSFRRQELAKNAFAAFLFQIVFAPKRTYRAQTKSLARSRQKFPRTAVKNNIACFHRAKEHILTFDWAKTQNPGSLAFDFHYGA